jgi:hypothetical protein
VVVLTASLASQSTETVTSWIWSRLDPIRPLRITDGFNLAILRSGSGLVLLDERKERRVGLAPSSTQTWQLFDLFLSLFLLSLLSMRPGHSDITLCLICQDLLSAVTQVQDSLYHMPGRSPPRTLLTFHQSATTSTHRFSHHIKTLAPYDSFLSTHHQVSLTRDPRHILLSRTQHHP